MLGRRIYYEDYELSWIIEYELVRHPRARLVDLFKLINQAYFGPSHINPDKTEIIRNLRTEILGLDSIDRGLFQDIGNGRTFVRVSLSYLIGAINVDLSDFIKDFNILDLLRNMQRRVSYHFLNQVAEAILQSRFSKPISPITWKNVWMNALPFVLEQYEPMDDELDEIEECLSKNVMPSHSPAYRKLYNPHYRVFNRKALQRQINIVI